MDVLIDANFAVACMKKKIDFVSVAAGIFDRPVSWLIPIEVLGELGRLSRRKGAKTADKEAAALAIDYLKKNNAEEVVLGQGNIDRGIANYASRNGTAVATLDRGLRAQIKEKILTIKGDGLELF